jgi:hypothetical protein
MARLKQSSLVDSKPSRSQEFHLQGVKDQGRKVAASGSAY